jgi:hypothetical protein
MTSAIANSLKAPIVQPAPLSQQSVKSTKDSDGDNDGSSATAVKQTAPALGSVGTRVNTTA